MRRVEKTPTIQDVARIAKVSTATVSRALSTPQRVSTETITRVNDAVALTGYTPNEAARSLRQKTAKTILVALPDIGNSFFSSILDAIEKQGGVRGYGVLVTNRFKGADVGRKIRDYFISNRVDGLLLFDGSMDVAQLQGLKNWPETLPLILVCEEIKNAPFHTVITDNEYASEVATKHLISLGHKRIGHITGPAKNPLTQQRMAGYIRALQKAGLASSPSWIFQGRFDMDSGAKTAEKFVRLKDRPTAIFAANDESAFGFLAGIRRHGLDCPRDVSVVGFDDLTLASHSWPPLTTMRQPREALGRIAANALIDVIEGKPGGGLPMYMVLSSELIVRGSSAAPLVESI
jgi:LacI family repressor for deo operon, udp, cdd, tsx, nupC, and nupG